MSLISLIVYWTDIKPYSLRPVVAICSVRNRFLFEFERLYVYDDAVDRFGRQRVPAIFFCSSIAASLTLLDGWTFHRAV